MKLHLLLVAPLALGLGSCLQLRFQREARFEPVDELAAAALVPGEADLARCLATFGAPLWVFEVPTPDGVGAALAWGSFYQSNWGVQLSAPVTDWANASVDYDDIDESMRGLVLFFDADWKLTAKRLGLLRDLTASLRRKRPLDPEDF